jgi:hypothetical protein
VSVGLEEVQELVDTFQAALDIAEAERKKEEEEEKQEGAANGSTTKGK